MVDIKVHKSVTFTICIYLYKKYKVYVVHHARLNIRTRLKEQDIKHL